MVAEISPAVAGVARERRRPRDLSRLPAYALLCAGAAMYLLPFLWMVTTALKTADEVLAFPPDFLPSSFAWHNFPEAWTQLPFTRFLLNTVLVTVLAVAGTLVSSIVPAYAFARLPARGRPVLFAAMIGTMMIPAEITLVPQFLLFKELGMVNTYWPLILPAWFGYAYYIFLFRQFFRTIPQELVDAARIDGASHARILWSVMLPLAKPAIAAVTVFSVIGNWNNLLGPLIYLRDQDAYTLALGLSLFQGEHATAYHHMMAVSTLTVMPIVVLFFLAQKAFVRGITLTGLGGR
ncbi:ABC-type glycerol-3-phosphate transport system permease component [Thermocatellispora tengchongensis]|uniref:ABC-type glycerol-3-phosphate transport system permease component n=1 Tax=Thermocatellispora tengchongensis TaxID=1073253 RepID=A0A840P993_9ACTN|nr:carbohydrate ABC transporter permease [Thermocatellispora tengchongensis]MBB5137954.1 ABC-type glycerol-3-phosphate transport system permease component [Thermocatellispora tengchongensis]